MAKASLIGGAPRGQATGHLPLHDSCFSLAYHHFRLHLLPLFLLTSACTMATVSCDPIFLSLKWQSLGEAIGHNVHTTKELPCEGIVAWSILPFITIIDLHTFNSGQCVPLDPRQRLFIFRRQLLQFTEALSPTPNHPVTSVSTSTLPR